MRLITKPDLVLIAEHHGAPAAVLHCVLDINPLLRKLRGRVAPLGYLGFRWGRRRVQTSSSFPWPSARSIAILGFLSPASGFSQAGRALRSVETTWMSPDNVPALRAAETLGMRPDKHFAIYEKSLTVRKKDQAMRSQDKLPRPGDWGLGAGPEGELMVEEFRAVDLAKEYGTPLHVVHEARLAQTALHFRGCLKRLPRPNIRSLRPQVQLRSRGSSRSSARPGSGRSNERIRARAGHPSRIRGREIIVTGPPNRRCF